MPYGTISYNREELYKQVWAEPKSKLARKYRLSNVGLAKIYKKLKIPRPPHGYWVKKEFGKPVRQMPLPPFDGNNDLIVKRYKTKELAPHKIQLNEAEIAIAAEELPQNQIIGCGGKIDLPLWRQKSLVCEI